MRIGAVWCCVLTPASTDWAGLDGLDWTGCSRWVEWKLGSGFTLGCRKKGGSLTLVWLSVVDRRSSGLASMPGLFLEGPISCSAGLLGDVDLGGFS